MSISVIPGLSGVDRARLRALLQREQAGFAERNTRSAAAYARGFFERELTAVV